MEGLKKPSNAANVEGLQAETTELSVKVCVIEAAEGSTIAKVKKLQHGEIITESAGNLQHGKAHNKTFDSMQALARFLDTASPNIVMSASTLALDGAYDLVTVDKWKEAGQQADTVTRSKQHLAQRPGYGGLLTIDCDDKEVTKAQLLERVKEVIPTLDSLARVYTTSASSHLVNTETGEDLTKIKGQRLYIAIKDQSDIGRSISAIIDRLWLAGYGHIEVGAAGQALERTLADKALGNVAHLDYIGGSICKAPLKQSRPPAQWFEGDVLDTAQALPELSKAELKELQQIKATEKALKKPEIDEAKAAYTKDKALENLASEGIKNPTDDELENAEANVMRALDTSTLTGDFLLTMADGERLTIAQILSNRDLYDGAETKDPLEPNYNGGAQVGKLYLDKTQPKLHSFAHGGRVYKLFKQSRRTQHVHGATAATTAQTLELMAKLGNYYNMGSNLVTVRRGSVVNFGKDLLGHELGGVTQYYFEKNRTNKDDIPTVVEVNIDPPKDVTAQILALQTERPLPALKGVISAPTIAYTGDKPGSKAEYHIVCKAGHDPVTGLYLTKDSAGAIPTGSITPEQVKTAYNDLMAVIDTFSFAPGDSLSRSAALAALMTSVIRGTVSTAPIFGISAPAQGSGKTLFTHVVSALGTGKIAPMNTAPKGNDAELKKIILSKLANAEPCIVFDNIVGTFDSVTLAALTTAPEWNDRVLGKTEDITLPNKSLIMLTSNNLQLRGELPRRVIVIKLNTGAENPINVKRDLSALGGMLPPTYVKANRGRLVCAVITIIKAYLDSADHLFGGGMDKQALASFEDWDRLVRQPMLWLNTIEGIDDIADVKQSIEDNLLNDPVKEELATMLHGLYALKGTTPFTSKEIYYDIVEAGSVYRFEGTKSYDVIDNARLLFKDWTNKKEPDPRTVGHALANRIDRPNEGLMLELYRKDNKRGHQYRIVKV